MKRQNFLQLRKLNYKVHQSTFSIFLKRNHLSFFHLKRLFLIPSFSPAAICLEWPKHFFPYKNVLSANSFPRSITAHCCNFYLIRDESGGVDSSQISRRKEMRRSALIAAAAAFPCALHAKPTAALEKSSPRFTGTCQIARKINCCEEKVICAWKSIKQATVLWDWIELWLYTCRNSRGRLSRAGFVCISCAPRFCPEAAAAPLMDSIGLLVSFRRSITFAARCAANQIMDADVFYIPFDLFGSPSGREM